ncbi:hypothetical protein [Streptomyces decoyicus]|uniref:hypothetical protein n=1 Tax=Streptomyces decoyicus TaxID=249567 RepID=UPI003828F121
MVAIVAAVTAILSAGIAGLVFKESRRTQVASDKANRRDLFLALHERLSHRDQQRGRTILREMVSSTGDAKEMRGRDRDSYDLMMSSIAMLDILGLYVEKDYIDKDVVFDEWGWLYARAFEHGQHVLNERAMYDESRKSPWPHFRALGEEAISKHPATPSQPGG